MKTQKQDLGKVSLTCNGTWDAGKQYDRLCIVNDGNFASYISKKDVPIGTVLSDERFWQPIANLRDDIKIDYETFKKEWLELLASIQIKLRSARVVVANEEARNNLTWLEVAAGCEVYELDTQLTYILDSIVPVINLKSWHLVVGSLLDSEAKFQLDGTYELTAERAIADRWGYIIDEVYVSKKEVKNLVLSIVNDKLENISITIPPNSIKPEDLSQAVLDLIGSGGNVVNNPDEEDITSESLSNGTSVLKFKDRDYVEGTFNGLGEIILRKNQVGIVNLLEQVNINKPNTVYVVRYDFCLGGATITLPKNSTLKFEGGSIDNGTIVGNNSCIISDIDKTILGKDLVIEGTWNIEHIYDRWFAFDSSTDFLSNQIITNILALSNDNVYNTIHFDADRTYYFENTYKGKTNLGDDVRPNYWLLNTPDYDFLRIFTGFTSNTHLIVNNTIQMLPTNQGAYFIFHIENKENITISGTGAINGDAKDHLYTGPFAGTDYYGEWGHVLNFRSCNNVVVRDITIGYAFGDGIALGNAAYNNNGVKEAGLATKNVTIDAVKVLYARRNGISLGGNNYTITNVYFEGNGSDTIKGTAPMAAIDFENDYVDIEPSGLCTNVSMNNCKFKDNKYDVSSTIRDDLYEVPRGELVNISDCNFTSPLRLNRTNGLTFSNCHVVGITNVDNSIAAWYSSKDLVFNNCIFDELNPYLAISAEEQNKKFINPTYPEDIRYSTTFQHNLPVGKALKFTIPKPLVGEVEFTAFCSNPNYSNIQMPVNTTIYTFGPSQRLTGIRDIKIKASQDSTPRYSMYKNTPVFSYINYTEDSNNFIIYFAIGGDLIGDSYASATSVNIFLTSKTKFITVEAPVSGRPDYAGMYGGKWSELSAIIKESVVISSIPSTVTFPSKEMYSGNMLADLPTSLTADKVGFSQFVLDGSYKRPVFWDSYSKVFRTADGNKALERRVTSLAELDVLTAKLTVNDRGYVVYYTVTTSYLTWRGTDWTNEDGSLFSKVKYIKQTNTIDILNTIFSYSDVIYKICADIDLGGGTLTIVTGSILDFQGGSFSNGTIVGSNTKIKAGIEKIFDNITIDGTWNCSEIYDDWFTKVDDSFVNLQNMCNLTSDVLLGNIYINQNHTITIPSNAASIKPNSNTIINIKGTIAVNPNEFTNYYVFRLIDKNNVTFTGGGSLIGDVETHTGTTGEWGHGLFIQGSNNITISNLNLTKFWGDGIEVDKSSINAYTSELYIKDLTISNNRRQGISLLSVKNIFIDNCIIYGIGSINGTNPKGAIDIEPEGEDIAENVFISNCIEYSNGLGITAHNAIKGIVVDNCTCLSSQGIWHTGDITFKNCSFGRYFNLEGDIIKFINCDMPITNIISSNLVEIDNCRFRSKVSFDTVSDKTSLLCFNYSDTGINKTCKVKVRNSSFDNTKEGTSSIPLVKKALAKNMGDKDVVFENCSFRNTLSYLYGSIQYGDYYNCLFEVPSLVLQLYADKAIKIVGSTIVKNDTVTDRAILTIESITKNFTKDSVVLFLTGNTFQYSGVSIIDIPATNTNDKKVSFLNNLFSTKYISEESTLYINLKNKFDTFYYSNSRMDYNRYIGTTGTEGTPSVNNAGQVFYDSTLKKMKLWNGTAWTNLDGTTL